MEGTRHKSTLQSFKNVKDELIISQNGILMRGNRIVIPEVLQNKVIDIAHEGHLGIQKTKQLLRESVWFPHIDKLVATKIDLCLPCQATTFADVNPEISMS